MKKHIQAEANRAQPAHASQLPNYPKESSEGSGNKTGSITKSMSIQTSAPPPIRTHEHQLSEPAS